MNATNICHQAVRFARLFLALSLLLGVSGCGVAEYEQRLETTRVNGWPIDEPAVIQDDPSDETTEAVVAEEDVAAPESDEDALERLRQMSKDEVESGKILE